MGGKQNNAEKDINLNVWQVTTQVRPCVS